MARPTPVLPEVGSMIVPPGRSCPDASAAATMRSAIRSLTDPPGLKYSTLARTWGAVPPPSSWVTRCSRTSGVFPTNSISDPWTCIASHLPCGAGAAEVAPRLWAPAHLTAPAPAAVQDDAVPAVLLHRRYPTPAPAQSALRIPVRRLARPTEPS